MDQIKFLLESTGLSPDELIKKLSEYKFSKDINVETSQENEFNLEPIEIVNNGIESHKEPVILDTIEIIDDSEENGTDEPEENGIDEHEDFKESNKKTGDTSEEIICATPPPAVVGIPNTPDQNISASEKNVVPSAQPSTSRLTITSLISNRLSIDTPVEIENHSADSENSVVESELTVKTRNKPIIGRIVKSYNKTKSKYNRKPPWLCDLNDENNESEDITCEGDVRMKLLDQLDQLRKQANKPFNIVNTAPREFSNHVFRNLNKSVEGDGLSKIKIVDVRGGISEDSTYLNENKTIDAENIFLNPCDPIIETKIDTINDESEANEINTKTKDIDKTSTISDNKYSNYNCDVINKDLDSHAIKVTKTQDFTKIKGWRKKKLLIDQKQFKIETAKNDSKPKLIINIPVPSDLNNEPVPSCSYTGENSNAKKNCDSNIQGTEVETISKNSVEDTVINIFASNNLDDFLNQQKSLNISYDVPNLKSENSSNIDLLDNTVIIKETKKEENTHSIHKRRYTMAETEDSSCINQNNKTDPYKPRTLAEKRKLLEGSENGHISKKIKFDIPAYSSVYFRGKCFKVPSKVSKPINIDYRYRSRKYKYIDTNKILKKEFKKKPSIYINFGKPEATVSYKPGPLCKKINLQSNNLDKWTAVIKPLPKLFVEVCPEVGRPIHPKVAQFLKFDRFFIDEERTEFALSALWNTDDGAKFKFAVPYEHNQEKILLRKPNVPKKIVPEEEKVIVKSKEEDIDKVVDCMLQDMITCIENRDIENTIIKDDPDFQHVLEEIEQKKNTPIKSNKNCLIPRKNKKTNLELKRLNVKVIEVAIEDETESTICVKPYCKLGCVCKSLSNISLSSDHCAQAECIFFCKCGFERCRKDTMKFVLPCGTDILSERTVNRLQNEAKKNLAKVEKEFTQTVIHANNQTIVVGKSTDRKRRPLKYPKRYEDYIENEIDDDIKVIEPKLVSSPVKSNASSDKINKPPILQPCSVLIQKLDLDHIMPFCLEHNLYECHCLFRASYSREDCGIAIKSNSEITETKSESKIFFKEAKRPKLEADLTENETSARTKGTPTSYYLIRNRTAIYKKKLAKKLRLYSTSDEVSNDFLNKWLYDNKDVTNSSEKENSQDGVFLAESLSAPSVDIEISKPSRRKQLLTTRDDLTIENIAPAMQRRKKYKKNKLTKDQQSFEIENSIFSNLKNDEMLTPTGTVSMQFAEMTGQNKNPPEFRLLQWSTLMDKYYANDIEIWFMSIGNKLKFLITDPGRQPSSAFQNIREYEKVKDKESIKIDLIKWIVRKQLPDEKNGENTLVIMQKSMIFWEICGICAKNSQSDKNGRASVSLLQNNNWKKPEVEFGVSNEEVKNKTQEYIKNANEKYKTIQKVVFTNNIYNKIELFESNSTTPIEAHLPIVEDVCKWRVLKVNSSFSILAFKRNMYRIKCSDIITIIKLAKRSSKTITINTADISKNYTHKCFGIYISPNHTDKIFIGPYLLTDKHDIETLRFVNNVLVNTEVVDKMRGNQITCCTGSWYNHSPQTTPTSVIDLTETEEDKSIENSNGTSETTLVKISNNTTTTATVSSRSLLKINVLNGNKSEQTDDTNNLPFKYQLETLFISRLKVMMKHLMLPLPQNTHPVIFKVNFDNGVIHGYKNKRKCVVYWPDSGSTAKMFVNSNVACEWLQAELGTHFILLPSNFKIKVEVGESKDCSNMSCNTISNIFFKDLMIVGDFGILKILDVLKYLTMPMHEREEFLHTLQHSFRESFKKFLASEFLRDPDFQEKCMLQVRSIITIELSKKSKFADSKRNLESRKFILLKELAALWKDYNGVNKEVVKQEFLSKWKSHYKPPNPFDITEPKEVICLDSDEEEEKETRKDEKVENTIEAASSFIKISDLDALKETKINECINIKSVESIVSDKNLKGKSVMPRTIKITIPKRQINVEKIDLSHISAEQVRVLIGGNLHSGKVTLSKAQLNSLKALSETNKQKIKNDETNNTEGNKDESTVDM